MKPSVAAATVATATVAATTVVAVEAASGVVDRVVAATSVRVGAVRVAVVVEARAAVGGSAVGAADLVGVEEVEEAAVATVAMVVEGAAMDPTVARAVAMVAMARRERGAERVARLAHRRARSRSTASSRAPPGSSHLGVRRARCHRLQGSK
jgi:hypothetical protein